MAGDWIKMREELFSHPRFLRLCTLLTNDPDCRDGFLAYVCGEDILEIGVFPGSHESVTDRALRGVTEVALRDVTLSVLLRVWCRVNQHGKVVGRDALMSPMTILDLDPIAGFVGFGVAFQEVGWVLEQEPNSLLFPNFLEFNEPASLRVRAKTDAERQRACRRRKAAEKSGEVESEPPVTTVTKCHGREEKRREEKSNTPLPPFSTALFADVWGRWVRFRREIKKPLTPSMIEGQYKKLARFGETKAIAALEQSIANGWQGIFEPKEERNGDAAGHGGGVGFSSRIRAEPGKYDHIPVIRAGAAAAPPQTGPADSPGPAADSGPDQPGPPGGDSLFGSG